MTALDIWDSVVKCIKRDGGKFLNLYVSELSFRPQHGVAAMAGGLEGGVGSPVNLLLCPG